MSAHDITKIAPGVVRSFDGKRAIYAGSGDALIAAGIVEPAQLQDPTGMARGVCTFDADGKLGGFNPGHGLTRDRVGSKEIVAKKRRGTGEIFYEVRVLLGQEQHASMQPRSSGALRPRIGGVEPRRLPVKSSAWPFPVSYGRQDAQRASA